MQIFHDLDEWRQFRASLPATDSIGFVPTMGNLHAGHQSLFLASAAANQHTIASLFINPTQFNQPEDFARYPRTLDRDIQLMTEAGVDYCLLPTEDALYADGYTYRIQETVLCKIMEGAHRPGHFDGVLTVVMKLFHLTRPDTAYFGEKDYQQYLLIQAMVNAFFMNIRIQACPTVRESSGLAYSSRNNRLTPEQKIRAETFAALFHQDKSCADIIQELTEQDIKVEYVTQFQDRKYAAVVIGDIRLIDNYACTNGAVSTMINRTTEYEQTM